MNQSVVVIGNFDGVHPGHRAVIDAARALEPGIPLIVVTFWPHPLSVVRPGQGPLLLTRLEERVELLRQAGADEVKVINFTKEFSQLSPEAFLAEVVEPLNPVRVVVGENFRFGFQAAGDISTLQAHGGFAVTALPLVTYGDQDTCSTAVRQALVDGDLPAAMALLGRPFRFTGTVKYGDQRGRLLGFPTANLPVPNEMACPSDGVYAGWVTRLDGCDEYGRPLPIGTEPARWPAAISVGTNPTFDGSQRRVESNVLDRTDLELYDAPIAVDFCERIRGQIRFDGVDALIAQMNDDVARCRELLFGCPTESQPSSP